MNLNEQKLKTAEHDREAALSGLGANVLWDGPLDTTGLPKGKGSSSGKDGIILNNIKPQYNGEPITQRAKPKF
jgi:hypothetical protein